MEKPKLDFHKLGALQTVVEVAREVVGRVITRIPNQTPEEEHDYQLVLMTRYALLNELESAIAELDKLEGTSRFVQ